MQKSKNNSKLKCSFISSAKYLFPTKRQKRSKSGTEITSHEFVHIRSNIPTIDISPAKTQSLALSPTQIRNDNPGKFVSNNFKDLKEEVEYLSNRFETEVMSHPKVCSVNTESSTLYLDTFESKSKQKFSRRTQQERRKSLKAP